MVDGELGAILKSSRFAPFFEFKEGDPEDEVVVPVSKSVIRVFIRHHDCSIIIYSNELKLQTHLYVIL